MDGDPGWTKRWLWEESRSRCLVVSVPEHSWKQRPLADAAQAVKQAGISALQVSVSCRVFTG